jgi:integrase
MISLLQKKNNYVFGHPRGYVFKVSLFKQRKGIAEKLGNPGMGQIHFHTLRYWKATMLYHQTEDLLYAREFLGHRNIECTMIYIQLNKALFTRDSDEFNCKIARNEKDATGLIEAGFEYVCDMENAKFFRKRKWKS